MSYAHRPKPDPAEHAALLEQIGPLPLQGTAWPRWTKITAWVVLALIAFKLISTAAGPAGHDVSPLVSASILLCFVGLAVVARFMVSSRTTISPAGITQSWIVQREIAWDDIQFAKFVPFVASKRLVCFTARGRPVIFQAGTRELQTAFARIALVYRRR